MTKQTLNGTKRKRIKTSGFRARMKTATGRRVIRLRRQKGRIRLATSR
uniref:Ribosomal protein L34 n=1 Tax=Rhodochaete parvula TaxID=110510 RepID=A0A1X9PUN8_9RHOD|nr:50S ribosomal protein L34 [Rhodochaete parvula]ASK39688.1 ribosomal protein L34 [Rhodochaete parvula]